MYDVSGATGAIYTNTDHSEFSVSIGGVLIEAKAMPGLLLFDALLANAVPIAEYVPPVPQSVTPRQARLALLGAGLLDQVESAVDQAGGATKITWEYATEIRRDDPLIESIGNALGLNEAQKDALFISAASL